MKPFCVCVLSFLLLGLVQAFAGPDEQYVRIYNSIQEADTLNAKGQQTDALAKYLQAESNLQKFQQFNPDWNIKIVNFRLNYLKGKIAGLGSVVPAPAIVSTNVAQVSGTNVAAGQAKSGSPGLEAQLNSLRDQVRQMQVDKIMLEAKLKESLAAQPAATDPRELAKAEDRIKSLQKENALLNISLAQTRTNAAPAADTVALQQAQQALGESNRRITEQTDKINSLAQEKAALQQKLDTLLPSSWNASALEAAKKALEDKTRELAAQKDATMKAGAERDKLQTRVNELSTEAEAASALKAENELLKKQVADLRTAAPAPDSESERKLAVAQAQIAALQSDKELLRVERTALQNRVKQLALIANRAPNASRPEDVARIKQLERERDELQKRLETASKELASKSNKENKVAASRVLDMEKEMAGLRARLDVLEARAVPYTAEELALFKRPDITLTEKPANVASEKKSVKELSPGSATLVADAQRYFSEKQFDKAEEKYLEVLKANEKNVPTLANLATIQMERTRYEEAEKHIKQAIALAPEDAYSWSVLGQLKFRQEKYDDALDALSRAAKLDPQDAQIQNYLGITLSQKGMRGPAETALRKAIQLDPENASAHHNLAVVYLTQRPPLVELARWHYQKAISGGHPRNPDMEKVFKGEQTTKL
jgi:tetratricopeptide (TPR) repeat protein